MEIMKSIKLNLKYRFLKIPETERLARRAKLLEMLKLEIFMQKKYGNLSAKIVFDKSKKTPGNFFV